MFSKLAILSAALLAAAPVLAANSGGAASSGASAAAISSNSGGHAGGSVGGGSGGGGRGGGSFGAHSAAMSTHLGGAGHTLHAAAAHAGADHVTQGKHVAMRTESSKKPGHDHDHSHHFLHHPYNAGINEWASYCLWTLKPPDSQWSDCDRPAKTNPHPRS